MIDPTPETDDRFATDGEHPGTSEREPGADPFARLRTDLTRLLRTVAERGEPLIRDLAERGDPLLRGLAETPTAHGEPGATCDWCPVCVGIALLRGQRPETATRIAGQLSDLLTTLRAAMDTPTPAPADEAPEPVQRITVERQ